MGFQDDIDVEPKRDRWGRPLLVPAPDGPLAGEGERTWYSRASSLSDFASGVKTGLETWKRRHAVVGVARREDIAAMIAALPDMDTGDQKDDKVTKAQVDEYIEEAMTVSGATAKAAWGTAVHGFTADGDPENAPERMRADIEAYHRELERLGIEPVLSEVFVANDGLRAAGTFDHLYRLPDGRVVVGDKKTGVDNPLDTSIQIAAYASDSSVYDWRTDERTPLCDVAGSFGVFDPTIGLHVHIPRGEGRCEVKALDLTWGYRLASACAMLRDAGHAAHRDDLIETSPKGMFLLRINSAATVEELLAIMEGVDDGDYKEAANLRWRELTS